MKRLMTAAAVFVLLLGANLAHAHNLSGHVYCDGQGLPISGVTIQVVSTDGAGFSGAAVTDESGYYIIWLPGAPGCYRATLVPGSGQAVVSPAGGTVDFCITETVYVFAQDWVISSPE